MNQFRILAINLLLASPLILGCQAPNTNHQQPATVAQRDELKKSMTEAFGALEIYAADNSLQYPEKIENIVPKYLKTIPVDPKSGKNVVYKKTANGFRLGASGDYSSLDAETGYPQMSQDGFFCNKEAEFPTIDN